MAGKKIEDFGEKIGGARKDLYAPGNIGMLTANELAGVTRDKIWKKPDIRKELGAGADKALLYWKEMCRKALPPKPRIGYGQDAEALRKGYIRAVNDFMAFTEEASSIDTEGWMALVGKYFRKSSGRYWEPSCDAGSSISWNGIFGPGSADARRFARGKDFMEFGLTKAEAAAAEAARGIYVSLFAGIGSGATPAPGQCVLKEEAGRCVLAARSEVWTRYYYLYPGKHGALADAGSWEPGTYALLSKGAVLANGLRTAEEAEAAKEEAIAAASAIAAQEASGKGKAGKKAFVPPQLGHVRQERGYAPAGHADGEGYMSEFGFRGGEYGNWMTGNDRQASLDMGFTAFKDLAMALGIGDGGISLGGKLAIAFGARGHSAARAHYEPGRNVINLTKMSGAGALAHEWGHALDAYIASASGLDGLATAQYRSDWCGPRAPIALESFTELVRAMRLKKSAGGGYMPTDYLKGSEKFGKMFRKNGGYWESREEMFARAFDCYVHDRLRGLGITDTYLSAFSESFAFPDGDGGIIRAYPEGEERERLCSLFDTLLSEMKEKGLLPHAPEGAGQGGAAGAAPEEAGQGGTEGPAEYEGFEQMSLFGLAG